MNTSQLAKFCTSALDFADGLRAACALFVITDGLRLQHFLAQCAHESGGFTKLSENLNYSADALCRLWPARFPGDVADAYARQPQKIANRVYGGRMGNGDEASGEGWRYRGRGLIQLTGRENYGKASQAIFGDLTLIVDPDQVAEPRAATLSAAWFWQSHACNELADADDLDGITRRINGGLNGIGDRQQWLDRAKECFT